MKDKIMGMIPDVLLPSKEKNKSVESEAESKIEQENSSGESAAFSNNELSEDNMADSEITDDANKSPASDSSEIAVQNSPEQDGSGDGLQGDIFSSLIASESQGLAVDVAKNYFDGITKIALAVNGILAKRALENPANVAKDAPVVNFMKDMVGSSIETIGQVKK